MADCFFVVLSVGLTSSEVINYGQITPCSWGQRAVYLKWESNGGWLSVSFQVTDSFQWRAWPKAGRFRSDLIEEWVTSFGNPRKWYSSYLFVPVWMMSVPTIHNCNCAKELSSLISAPPPPCVPKALPAAAVCEALFPDAHTDSPASWPCGWVGCA